VVGTESDLVESNESGEEYGRVLSLVRRSYVSSKSCVFNCTAETAHEATSCEWLCDSTFSPFPADQIRWWSAATTGAYQRWQISEAGTGLEVYILCGVQVWLVAKPRPDKPDGGSPGFYKKVEQGKIDNEGWIVEAVILREGDQL